MIMKSIQLINKQTDLATFIKIILIIFYAVGGIAAFTPYNSSLMGFTPFLLFTSFLILVSQESHKNSRLYIWYTGVYLASFFIEWHGVHFGLLFGEYIYMDNLGIKIDGVPLMIPVNWLILAVAGTEILKRFPFRSLLWIKALIGGAIVVTLDVLIERVCESLGFWSWYDGMPPLKNYLSWWLFMSVFIYFRAHLIPSRNSIAIFLFIVFFFYFILQNISILLT